MTDSGGGTLPTQGTHYELLGVPRDAAAGAIKKAYAGMLRKFPPEKAPEEFKRIRAAYEVLSDDVARKRYDDSLTDFEEHGEKDGGALREIQALMRNDGHAEAEGKLKALLEERPDFHEARTMLGHCLRAQEKWAEARAAFEALCEAQPDKADHHVARAYTLVDLQKPAEAEKAFRRAVELDATELDGWLGLATSLSQQKRGADALTALKEGLRAIPGFGAARLGLLVRCVFVELLEVSAGITSQTLPQLLTEVAAQKDPELDRYVSGRLAQVAALLFARDRHDDANALLRRCEALNPGSTVERPWPRVVEADVESLPEATREHLGNLRGGRNSPTVEANGMNLPLVLLGSGAASLLAGAFYVVNVPGPLDGLRAVFVAAMSLAGAVCGAAGAHGLLARVRSTVGAGVSVGDLYVLKWTPTRLLAYPLFHLGKVNVVRHTYNGVYTHTEVQVKMSARSLSVTLRDEGYAQAWAQHLLDSRQRALELLHGGYLDTVPEADLIPRSTTAGTQRPLWKQPWVRWSAWALVPALLALGSLSAVCGNVDDLATARMALGTLPVASRVAQWETSRPRAPDVAAVDALHGHRAQDVTAEVSLQGNTPSTQDALSAADVPATSLAAEVTRTVVPLLADVLDPVEEGQKPTRLAHLALTGRVTERGAFKRAGQPDIPAFQVEWEARLLAPGAATPEVTRFVTPPPHALPASGNAASAASLWKDAVSWHVHQAARVWARRTGVDQLPARGGAQ